MKKLLIVLLVAFGLQTQAQTGSGTAMYFCCDSINYWIDQSQGFNVGLDTTNIVHNPESIEVWFEVCANGQCYPGQGMYSYYPQITTADTVKVGYDVYLYEANSVEVCSREEWVIFDGTSWVLFNMGNPTAINELDKQSFDWTGTTQGVFDMMGREVIHLTKGVIYIKNNQKFIIVE